MADFVRHAAHVLDSEVTIYTVPSGKTAIVIGAQAANTGDVALPLTMFWTDASDGDEPYALVDTVTVPDDAALLPVGGKLVLEPADTIRAVADDDYGDGVDVTVSVLEL